MRGQKRSSGFCRAVKYTAAAADDDHDVIACTVIALNGSDVIRTVKGRERVGVPFH